MKESAEDTEQARLETECDDPAAKGAEDVPAGEETSSAPDAAARSAGAEDKAAETAEGNPAETAETTETTEKKAEISVPSEWFKIGQKISTRIDTGKNYKTLVRGLTKETLYLDIPTEGNALIVPKVGGMINAHFVLNNSVYFFDAVLEGLKRLDGYPVWMLSMPLDFKRVQRRHALRMDLILPVRIRVEASEGIFMPTVKTNCLDISCGGVRYVLDYPLDNGKLVKLEADDFPGVGRLQALCKAVRAVKSEVSEENYWIGAQFFELPHQTENKIARHIFQIQRRILINSSSE